MSTKQLEENYQENQNKFHNFINNIKRNINVDIYSVINPTLIKNPYASDFPKKFFSQNFNINKKYVLFIKNTIKFYIKNLYLICSYLVAFVLYKIYYKKQRKNNIVNIIDIFVLVDKVNKNKEFNDKYLDGIYEVFKKYNTNYTFLLRPYGVNKNPFKLKKFFQIINKDANDFIFEYELLNVFDFFLITWIVVVYPFRTLRLLQKERNDIDKSFNYSLIYDITHFSFNSVTRYIFGKNLANINSIKKIYSWSEFQAIERGFNFGIRKYNDKIRIIACQFYLNYETYFNAYVDDIDFDMLSSPHRVLVNGKYYVLNRKKIKYSIGVSLRYKDVFCFKGVVEENNILLLGSYIEKDTKYMLETINDFDSVIFKNHPAVNIAKFGKLAKNITVSDKNIYKLFENTKLVIGTASGTSVEAIACGISVIIIASQDNLTANPLVDYGKGKIWDIAFNEDDMKKLYNKLIEYRKNNQDEIQQMARWYRDNFFVEPTEENIVKAFDLDGEIYK